MMRTHSSIIVALIASILLSCTDFQEAEIPVAFGVSETLLEFTPTPTTHSVTVSSGSKWDVTSKPEWISLQSISPGRSPFEWTANFSSSANDEYYREGKIMIKAGSEAAEISVTQEGKKGKYIAVESVSLSPTELTLTEGEKASLAFSITPSDASVKTVEWKTSDSSVATVSQYGEVEAIAKGTTIITITSEDGSKTASCSVTVKAKVIPVTGVSLDRTSLSMTEGDIQTLTATVAPSAATDKSVTWSSNNTSVATVSSSGVVTAKTPGEATITVKTNDGGKTATCTVTVNAIVVAVSGVSLDKTSISMYVGDTQTLTATVAPSDATDKSVTWSSSKTSVATVSSDGVITAKQGGTATITVKTNDGAKIATCTVTVMVHVSLVHIDQSSLSLLVGDTYTLKATVYPDNASDKSVTWSSSDNTVATVTSSGVVTAKANGTAVITVTTNDCGKTDKCSVTVETGKISVTGVSAIPNILNTVVGQTTQLYASVLPTNATDKTVSWSSDNTSVAEVSSSGLLTAKAAGTATITVTSNDGGKKGTCSVTVKERTVSVNGVSLNKTSLSMTVGDTQTLTATVTPSNATDKSVSWSSSNTAVATVSSSGVVTAKAAGSAKITVTTNDGGKTATCSVTVQSQTVSVTGISLDKTSITMEVGDNQTLTATVTPSNATDKSITWSSSNTSVASVSSSGVVTAKAAGSATITVTTNDGGKKATCSVVVQAKTVSVTGVSLNKTSLSMMIGDTQTLTATVTPSNATDKSVTWSSSNTSIATVSSSGVVTAKAVGSATITVTTNDGGKKETCAVTVRTQANNEIIYTSRNESIVNPSTTSDFGANLISNEYKDGRGILTFDGEVTTVGSEAFSSSQGLTSIQLPNSITSIGDRAFYCCSLLESLTIPNSVISIGSGAFYSCSSLTSVDIPNSVTSIGHDAFAYFPGRSIKIPKSVVYIGRAPFMGSQKLETIIVESGNTVYDSRNNCNAIINTQTNELIQGCKSTIIPNSVKGIGGSAFGSLSITSFEIPSSISSIGFMAFSNCYELTSITVYSISPPSLVNNTEEAAFHNTNNCPIYVPEESVEAYKTAWSAYADRILAISSNP